MRTYQTGIMMGSQIDNFQLWFDKEIGTEFEIDEHPQEDGTKLFSMTCFELEPNEVSKCRYYENNKI